MPPASAADADAAAEAGSEEFGRLVASVSERRSRVELSWMGVGESCRGCLPLDCMVAGACVSPPSVRW